MSFPALEESEQKFRALFEGSSQGQAHAANMTLGRCRHRLI